MADALILIGLGAAVGLVVGFVLGAESPRRCESCQANTGSRYMTGFRAGAQIGRKDGYCDGVKDAVELVERRVVCVPARPRGYKEAWVIEKDELEQIREDLTEAAYV